MKWQPIETAPKTGERFLAYAPNGREIDFFRWQDLGPDKPNGWRDGFITVYRENEGPTHWMSLPEPPK